MKTIFAILTIFTLLSGALYLFKQQSKEQSLESYQEFFLFNYGKLSLNLSNYNLDDYKADLIAQIIGSGKIQNQIGGQMIQSIYLDLSQNNRAFNFKPILESINSSLSSHLTSIEINLDLSYESWDENFEGYIFPSWITEIKLSTHHRQEKSLRNFSKAISSCKNLTSLDLDFYDGPLDDANQLAQVTDQLNNLREFSLCVSKNKLFRSKYILRDYIIDTLKKPTLQKVFLDVRQADLPTIDSLKGIKETIYNLFQKNQIQNVAIIVEPYNRQNIELVFADLIANYGDKFKLTLKY